LKRIKKLLPKLIIANFGIMAFSQIYFLLPVYLEWVGVRGPETVGWILGAFFAASTFPRPFLARFVERFPLRKVLAAAAALGAAGSVGLALSGASVPLLLLWRVVGGLAFGLFLVALTTYQTMVIPDEVRGGAFALIAVGAMAPFVISLPMGDWFLHSGHFTLFIWMGPLLAALCGVIAFMLRPAGGSSGTSFGQKWGTWMDLFRLRPMQVLLVSTTLYGLTDAAILSVTPLAMDRGLVPSAFMSSFGVAALFIRIVGFRILDLFPRYGTAAVVIAVNAAALFGTSFAETNLAFAFWGVLYGIGVGIGFPLYLALIGDAAPQAFRPKATALVWFILDGCFFVTPVIMGYLTSIIGAPWAFRLLPGLLFFTAPFLYWFLWRPLLEANKGGSPR
jgi:MFS family permease